MELEGQLEDVHLGEVLRVLAVSGRSGTLHVQGADDSGFITVEDGRVVAARVDSDRTPVDQVVAEAGIVDLSTLQELSPTRRRQPVPQCLEDLLQFAPELAEEVPRRLAERLQELCTRLLGMSRGTFSFVASSGPPPPCFLGDQGVSITGGLDAEVVAATARTALEAMAQVPRARTRMRMNAVTAPDAPDVVVVDDDAPLLAQVTQLMGKRGVKALGVGTAREGLQSMMDVGPAHHAVTVVDLVMPRVDGRGILGGLDLLKQLKANDPAARVILTFEVDHPDAARRARELGAAAVVRKPAPGATGPADVVSFVDAVLAAAGHFERAGSVNLGEELAAELGETHSIPPPGKRLAGQAADLQRALELLRDMVGPVNDPERRDEIPLMILRVASATFGRAALFLVTDAEFVGLGGFGLDANGRDPGKALRDTHIPVDADTVLAATLRERRGLKTPFFASEWNRYLADRLGGPMPTECYVAPVLSSRQVEAVLYCDNAVDGRALADTQVLDLFLTQAGAAMERAMLERRLLAQLGGAA